MAGRWFAKPGTSARAALGVDTVTVAGTPLRLDYDAGAWLLGPLPGEDRAAWVSARLAALREDFGFAEASDDSTAAKAALDAFARPWVSDARFGFLRVTKPREPTQAVTCHVGPANVLRGWLGADPDSWIMYADVRDAAGLEAEPPVDVADGPDWRIRVRVVELDEENSGLLRGLRQGEPLVAASAFVTHRDVDRLLSEVTDLVLGISVGQR